MNKIEDGMMKALASLVPRPSSFIRHAKVWERGYALAGIY